MSSKQQLTHESLICLLEEQRCTFTDQYRPLLIAQETAIRKANNVVAELPESLTRNYSKKKANFILNDIKNCISHDVFVLCALATNLSALGASRLGGDYVSTIGSWWDGVHHPKGLTMISERYRMRTSKIHLDELSESQSLQPTTSQDNAAQPNFEPGRPAASQSPTLLPRHGSIPPAAQPLRLDGLQNGPETGSQHGRVLVSNMMNPTPQKQPNKRTHDQVTDERSSKRPRLGPQQIPGNLILPGEEYFSFSFMSRHMIESLPEPFRTGMKMSNLWRKENESGGLAVTNCLTIYLPKTNKEDALFVGRIGYDDGFNFSDLFGFGDLDIPVSEEGAAKEVRD